MALRVTPTAPFPDVPEASGQGKPSRVWLYAPFALVAIAAVAWSAYWVVSSRALTQSLVTQADRLRGAGYELSWQGRKIDGYPFRLDVTVLQPRLRTPTGWVVTSPRLEAEAFLHSPGRWIMATPQGFSFTPAGGGPVEVTGSTLRAGLQDLTLRPPSVSMEGVGLRFKSLDPAAPFALTQAARLELHLRPGPDHQGAAFIRLEGGQPTPGTALGRWARSPLVSVEADALLNELDHAASAKTWSAAGGAITIRRGMVSMGSITATTSGRLALNPQAQVSGRLPMTLSEGGTVLGHQDMVFGEGKTLLSPLVYQP